MTIYAYPLLLLATAAPAAAQDIPPRPTTYDEITGCILASPCAARWLALSASDGSVIALPEPRIGADFKRAQQALVDGDIEQLREPPPERGLDRVADTAATNAPPRPETQVQIGSCIRDYRCASYWMALDAADNIVVLDEPRTGLDLEKAIKVFQPYLQQRGLPKPSAPAPERAQAGGWPRRNRHPA